MKILNICTFYLRASIFKNVFDRLIQKGHEINVFAPIQYGTSPVPLYGGALDEYVKVAPCYNKYDRFVFSYKQSKILESLTSQYDVANYNILHSHTLFSGGYVAYKINKMFDIPYVVTVRNTDVNAFFKYALHLRKIGVEILAQAAKIIFISTPYREKVINEYCPQALREMLRSKSVVIHNGIDDFWIDNSFLDNAHPQGRAVNLIFAGQVRRDKNIPIIIKACEVLKHRGRDVRLTVVGKVMDQKLYERIVESPFVRYLPFAQKETLIKLYREHDVFVMPSKHESFGRVYAEALTQGLPIVYTKNEGFDGLFDDGFVGYCVACNDYRNIADRIEDIIDNHSQISKNCSGSAKMFDWTGITNEIELSYYEAIEKREANL
jgi:glycosyltransferase involved in cell wall biosynthesis